MERHEDALEHHREALRIFTKAHGEAHRSVVQANSAVSVDAMYLGHCDEAARYLEAAAGPASALPQTDILGAVVLHNRAKHAFACASELALDAGEREAAHRYFEAHRDRVKNEPSEGTRARLGYVQAGLARRWTTRRCCAPGRRCARAHAGRGPLESFADASLGAADSRRALRCGTYRPLRSCATSTAERSVRGWTKRPRPHCCPRERSSRAAETRCRDRSERRPNLFRPVSSKLGDQERMLDGTEMLVDPPK